MKLHFWDLQFESLENFLKKSQIISEVLGHETLKELIDNCSTHEDMVVIDLDNNGKEIDDFVKKLKKKSPESIVIAICNSYDTRQLIKHQKSKSGADLYLRSPVDFRFFLKSLGHLLNIEFDINNLLEDDLIDVIDEERLLVNQVINAHMDIDEACVTEKMINEKIEKAYSKVYQNFERSNNNIFSNSMNDFEIAIDNIDQNYVDEILEEPVLDDKELSLSDLGEIEISDEPISLEINELENSDDLDLNVESEEIALSDELDLNVVSEDIDFSIENNIEEKDLSNDEIDFTTSPNFSIAETNIDPKTDLDFSTESDSSFEDKSLDLSMNEALSELDFSDKLEFNEVNSQNESDLQLSDGMNIESEEIIQPSSLDDLDFELSSSFHLNEIQNEHEKMEDDKNDEVKEFNYIVEESIEEKNTSDQISDHPSENSDSFIEKLAQIDEMMEVTNEALSIPNEDQFESSSEQRTSESYANTNFDKGEFQQISQHYNDELEKLAETIKVLKDDRESLQEKIDSLESYQGSEKREVLNLKAELDERKIEISLLKKRHLESIEDLKLKVAVLSEKKEILEIKNREYQKQLDQLEHMTKVDVNKVRSKEKELESMLELLKSDSQVQIRNRDQIILDLKRKIDTLEFDLEMLRNREKKTISSKHHLDDKVGKVIQALKNTLETLEEDNISESMLRDLKKNLDI